MTSHCFTIVVAISRDGAVVNLPDIDGVHFLSASCYVWNYSSRNTRRANTIGIRFFLHIFEFYLALFCIEYPFYNIAPWFYAHFGDVSAPMYRLYTTASSLRSCVLERSCPARLDNALTETESMVCCVRERYFVTVLYDVPYAAAVAEVEKPSGRPRAMRTWTGRYRYSGVDDGIYASGIRTTIRPVFC